MKWLTGKKAYNTKVSSVIFELMQLQADASKSFLGMESQESQDGCTSRTAYRQRKEKKALQALADNATTATVAPTHCLCLVFGKLPGLVPTNAHLSTSLLVLRSPHLFSCNVFIPRIALEPTNRSRQRPQTLPWRDHATLKWEASLAGACIAKNSYPNSFAHRAWARNRIGLG